MYIIDYDLQVLFNHTGCETGSGTVVVLLCIQCRTRLKTSCIILLFFMLGGRQYISTLVFLYVCIPVYSPIVIP